MHNISHTTNTVLYTYLHLIYFNVIAYFSILSQDIYYEYLAGFIHF